jgi:hypothetical protein
VFEQAAVTVIARPGDDDPRLVRVLARRHSGTDGDGDAT